MAFTLNRLLVRLAAEDAAQYAVTREIQRQLQEQIPGFKVVVEQTVVDIKIDTGCVVIQGEPAEWV